MILHYIHETIRDLRPSVDMLDYSLIDRADGVGPVIAEWNSELPQPSVEELEDQHPLTELRVNKERKIALIKSEAYNAIIQFADEPKQRNLLASSLHLVNKKLDALIAELVLGNPITGICLTDQEASFLSTVDTLWQDSINAVRQASNARELAVAAATNLAEVEAA